MNNEVIRDQLLNISYYVNGKLHRLDGPAVKHIDGTKKWYQNGKLHRLNGPAIEYSDGYKSWYYQGNFITDKSQAEFERIIKLKLLW